MPEAADTKLCSPSPEPLLSPRIVSRQWRDGEDEYARCGRAEDGQGRSKEAAAGGIEGTQKELASCKGALELFALFERDYRQSQDKQARALAEVNKRLEAAYAEVEELLFAKDRAESLRKKREEQVEILQQELTVVRQENEEMRISLKNLAHIMEEAASGAAN